MLYLWRLLSERWILVRRAFHLAARDRLHARRRPRGAGAGCRWITTPDGGRDQKRERLQAHEVAEFAHLSRADAMEVLRRQGDDVDQRVGAPVWRSRNARTRCGRVRADARVHRTLIEDIDQHLAEIRAAVAPRRAPEAQAHNSSDRMFLTQRE